MQNILPVSESEQALIFTFIYVASQMPETGEPIQRLLIEPSFDRYWKSWGRAGDIGFKYINPANQMPVGCAWLRLFTSGVPELTIGILDSWRNKGIGRLLIERVAHEAKLRGYPAITLSVRSDNQAIRLYERLNFKKIAESERVDEKGLSSFDMILKFDLHEG